MRDARHDLVADAQLGQRLAERVLAAGLRRRRPVCHTPVSAVSISGEPCTAVRCMWCSTARMPPSSSPPPARPGPPCTRCGSGEPWPGRASARRRGRGTARGRCTRRCPTRARRATAGSCVATLVTSEPPPRATSADRLVERVVADDRRDRARTPRPRAAPRLAASAKRSSIGATKAPSDAAPLAPSACVTLGASDRRRSTSSPPAASSFADLAQHLVALLERGERAHGDALGARVADHDALGDARAHGVDHGVDGCRGHDRPADRGALLPGLRRSSRRRAASRTRRTRACPATASGAEHATR